MFGQCPLLPGRITSHIELDLAGCSTDATPRPQSHAAVVVGPRPEPQQGHPRVGAELVTGGDGDNDRPQPGDQPVRIEDSLRAR